MPRWGKSVSRRRHLKVGHLCVCGCRESLDEKDISAGRLYLKTGHRCSVANPNWKGAMAPIGTARKRARRLYNVQPCSVCGQTGERHHIDGNANNNDPSNIAFLCRRHHMIADGRAGTGERIRAHMAEVLL